MERVLFGQTKDGQEVEGFVLRNKNGLEVRCLSYGCRITHILVPAADGEKVNVVLGYGDMAGYEADATYQGAVIGRYANRIGGAAFALDGQEHKLLQNDGDNYLHGSWHQRVWQGECIGDNSVSFTYISPDGEDGFPGEVWACVTYTITDENGLIIDYRAVPEAPTHINMTNHAYFNLAGGGDVLDHTLLVNASTLLEAGAGLIPTGRVIEAAGVLDFTTAKRVGQDIDAADPQLALGGGYDHCYIVDRNRPGVAFVADLRDPASGRGMKMYSTQPAVQVYSGNGLDGPFPRRGGLCLEGQHYPDTPHNEEFPPTLHETREKYHQTTIYDFFW